MCMCVWALIWFESEMVSLIQCIVATNSRTSPRVRAPNLVWEYISKTSSEGPLWEGACGGAGEGRSAWWRTADLNRDPWAWYPAVVPREEKKKKEAAWLIASLAQTNGQQSEPTSRINPMHSMKWLCRQHFFLSVFVFMWVHTHTQPCAFWPT